jgi:hypothetical protein
LRRLIERYRLPECYLKYSCSINSSGPQGFFTLGDSVVGYGFSPTARPATSFDADLSDVSDRIHVEGGTLRLPFDPDQVIENFLWERYPIVGPHPIVQSILRSFYYTLRPLLAASPRTILQRLYLAGWEKIRFPRWPVDTSVERLLEKCLTMLMQAQGVDELPFIWFWPDAFDSCAVVTHDVESSRGKDFCSALMDLDDSFGIKSSFQFIPESRYSVSAQFLSNIRHRGFEVNVHDLNHDGSLFLHRSKFPQQVSAINRYGGQFGAKGFRAGAMYRNQD